MNRRAVPVLLLAVALAGCGLGSRPLVRTHYYDLEPPVPSVTAAKPADLVLAVRPFESASRYGERIFIRREDGAVGYYEYDRWVEPPAEMATQAVTRALQAQDVARIVAGDRLLRRPDVVLDGRLTRFDQVQGKKAWTAECAVGLVLKRADDDRVLLAVRLTASRPAKDKSVGAFVEAMDAALGELAAQAAAAVSKALAALPKEPPRP